MRQTRDREPSETTEKQGFLCQDIAYLRSLMPQQEERFQNGPKMVQKKRL